MKKRKPPPPKAPPPRRVGAFIKPLDEALNDLFVEISKALGIHRIVDWLAKRL